MLCFHMYLGRGLDQVPICPVSSKKENESEFSTKKEQSTEVKQDKSNISGQKEVHIFTGNLQQTLFFEI